MKITDLFIRRPVVAVVLNLLILVGGLQALGTLTVRQYPRVESATVTVRTAYVGANADLVRGFITVPLERTIAAADGIDYIESQSTQGVSTILIRLRLNFPAAAALADISSRVFRVRDELPPEAEVPTIAIEPSDAQVGAMYLSFGSPILERNQLTDYLLRVVQPSISAVDGVQRADLLGGRVFAMRAWLDAERMAALGISASEVRRALAANNHLAAVGLTKGRLIYVNLAASTDLHSVEEFQRLVVRREGDTLVRLQDVADVDLGSENYEEEVRFSGRDAVFMGVWVLPTSNSVDVITAVRKVLAELQGEMPVGMTAQVAYDSTEYIEDAIREVRTTLLETIGIVILVIFAFMGSLRTVLVPVVAIPLSLIGAAFLMQVFGFTLNLLTLLAVVLSVGLVVDDAIVVVENVERHVREGEARMDAALAGARQLVGPIIAMTIALVAVYIPVGFQGGLTGALFREFAFTLAGAVMVSGVVALTLSPVMASRLLAAEGGRGRFSRTVHQLFDRARRRYEVLLAGSLRARGAVVAVWVTLGLLAIPMFLLSPVELAPNEDQGVVFTSLEVPANASIERVAGSAEQLQELFASDPDYHHSFQLSFSSGGFGGMLARPWSERARTIKEIQASLSAGAAKVPGVRAPMFVPAPLPSPGLLPVEVVIVSTANHEEILRFAQEVAQEANSAGQFAFPLISDLRIDQQRADIILDRDKVAAMGLTMENLGADLSGLLGGNYVNRFNLDGRSYEVIPELQRKDRLVPQSLGDVHVGGPEGGSMPLSAVATMRLSVEPRSLNRFQQLNAVKLSGLPTRSVDEALKVIEGAAARILPAGYRLDYTGESRQLRQETGRFLPALGLALLLIFLVLAAQFDSFRDPLVILLGSVPLALFGALIFTFLKFTGPPDLRFPLTEGWTTTMNIYSQVGLVTLVGLIARNAILIVQFANELQLAGRNKLDAVIEASCTRLRPILMVAAATIAGHFPLTLVTGPGAEARNAIGVILVGGMAIGTVFTLFVVPAVYMLIAKDHTARAQEPVAQG